MKVVQNEQYLINQVKESIKEYLSEQNAESNVHKGTAFTEWVLYNVFQLREDEVYEAILVSGKEDNGIDAIFELNGELCILQAKYETSHSIDSVHRFTKDCTRLLKNKPDSTRDIVLESGAKIREAYEKKEKINCFYVTNNELVGEWEKDQFVTSLKAEQKSYPLMSFELMSLPEIVARIEVNKGLLPLEFRTKEFKLRFQQSLVTDDTFVTNVYLKDLASFVNKGGNTLFHSNIRNYLKSTNINRGIKYTIENEIQNFWYFNNGITVVCDEWYEKSGDLIMKSPQIVNGCQSAKTIATLFKHYTTKDINNIQNEGLVLVKIIKTKKSTNDLEKKDFRDNITRFTNSQNAVRGLDFYALDRFQHELKNRFQKKSFYYEIQRGAFITEKPKDQQSYTGIEEYNYLLEAVKSSKKFVLPAKEVIQSFTAGIKLMPNIAYGRANLLTPIGAKWDEIMNEDTKSLEIEHFLFPYLVWLYAKNSLNYKQGQDGFRKNSAHLFVSTYYLLLMNLYSRLKQEKISSPTQIQIKHLQQLMSNKNVNKMLLKRADRTLTFFFRDSLIKDTIDDNLRGFLQNTLKNPSDYWNVLQSTVKDTVLDIEQEEEDLLKTIKEIFS